MADVESALLTFFDDMAFVTTVVDWRYLPENIANRGGVIRVGRIGGGADRDNDIPTLSFQCYASPSQANPRAAHDLEQQVWGRFLEVLNGDRPGWADGVVFEDPSKTSGPVRLPSTDPTITVVESIIRLTIRN